MSSISSFRRLLAGRAPVHIAGVFSAYTALAAAQVGHRALYLSGSLPSRSTHNAVRSVRGMTELIELARQITDTSDTPLLVDLNNGWDGVHVVEAIKAMEQAGVAAVHIGDQAAFNSLGGWVPKPIVNKRVMIDALKAAVDARHNPEFLIMAHTDAFAQEGLHGAIDRVADYVAAGADGIFVESVSSLADYRLLTDAIGVPVIAKANANALGKTTMFRSGALTDVGVSMIVHPMSGYEGANGAMQYAYQSLLDSCHSHTQAVADVAVHNTMANQRPMRLQNR